ncbi:MAG: hypothetical protein ACYC1D_18415 [Acidimicrobiales bacterium]
MRLVFLLFAEERRLPSDDATYVEAYSAGRLVEQLERRVALDGPQTLEPAPAPWHRLLALSRAIHQGVAHEDLRLPAYGGGLFDPDRYPWLEGRPDALPAPAATPPPIDDRTVLAMLRAVQYVRVAGERRRLTFRALDVEQIGYFYAGLLEYEARSATEAVFCFIRPADSKKQKAPSETPLSEMAAALDSLDSGALVGWVVGRTGVSPKRAATVLDAEPTPEQIGVVARALGGDEGAAKQMARVVPLLRADGWSPWTASGPSGSSTTASGPETASSAWSPPPSSRPSTWTPPPAGACTKAPSSTSPRTCGPCSNPPPICAGASPPSPSSPCETSSTRSACWAKPTPSPPISASSPTR